MVNLKKRRGGWMDLLEESKQATGCLDWHKHCNAECCRFIRIPWISNEMPKKNTNILLNPRKLSPDMIWYYKLHGCTYSRGYLSIPTRGRRLEFEEGLWLRIYRDCDLLKDNMCTGHPQNKPKFCRDFNENSDPKTVCFTTNCLFSIKRGETHGKN